ISRHPFEQFPNQGIVIFFNLRLLGFKKSLDLIEVALDSCVVGVFQKKFLLCIPNRSRLLKIICSVLFCVYPQKLFLFRYFKPLGLGMC
nr:hypothetical protein [Oscillospiraceae bacterium]